MEHQEVTLAVSKHEGAGNDFLIMIDLEDRVQLTSDEVRGLANRRSGIGADGVITILGPRDGGDLTMVLKNQDGSDAEISGNGIRCMAHEAVRAGLVAGGTFSIQTAAGLKRVHCEESEESSVFASVEMGELQIDDIDSVTRQVRVDIGNPHLVVVVDDLEAVDVAHEGRRLQKVREGGINVEWIQVLSRERLALAVFERGVGPTQACGSGTCAAAGAARALGLSGDSVDVANPGGILHVDLSGNEATLSGTVSVVADLFVPLRRDL